MLIIRVIIETSTFAYTGLCCQDLILPPLVRLLSELGPQCGLQLFLDMLTSGSNNSTESSIFPLLQLICDLASYTITFVVDFICEQYKTIKFQLYTFIRSFFMQANVFIELLVC